MEMSEIENGKTYKVLARKYRPKTLEELVGQDVLVQTITNAITANSNWSTGSTNNNSNVTDTPILNIIKSNLLTN